MCQLRDAATRSDQIGRTALLHGILALPRRTSRAETAHRLAGCRNRLPEGNR